MHVVLNIIFQATLRVLEKNEGKIRHEKSRMGKNSEELQEFLKCCGVIVPKIAHNQKNDFIIGLCSKTPKRFRGRWSHFLEKCDQVVNRMKKTLKNTKSQYVCKHAVRTIYER